ncbi:MAG: SDR family NAD(P)-dependent oxidoreductase [Bacteroidales bacterium]|nr:SDR family NAD(P)-dependent oxidoreductase [Bacteroidales bacterium]
MKALITGASSGIGEAFATKFAQLGYDLILTGRRMELLNSIAVRLNDQYKIMVEVVRVDLESEHDLDQLVLKIKETNHLEVLVNNGGYGAPDQFLKGEYRNHEKMVKVHVLAPMKLIYAALPAMLQHNKGIIINVSSLSANTPLATGALYSATKSFLRMFTESLYLENENSEILFQVLCPGFTKTDFHNKLGWDKSFEKSRGIIRWSTPEKVVETSLQSLKKGKVLCIPGFWNKVIWQMADIMPKTLYYKIISRESNRELKKHLKLKYDSY